MTAEKASDLSDVRFEDLVAEMIRRLGDSPDREGMKKTPERVAKAMAFLTKGYHTMQRKEGRRMDGKRATRATLRVIRLRGVRPRFSFSGRLALAVVGLRTDSASLT